MSCVSSYQFISHYNDDGIILIRNKLKDMWNYTHDENDTELFPFNKPDLKETGGKGCQFGDIYFCGFNYFDDNEFQHWLIDNKKYLYDIQVFFSDEDNEDGMSDVLK